MIDLQADKFDILLLYRAPTASALFDRARHAAPKARIVFHAVDLHFLRMEREAALTGSANAKEAATNLRALELDLIARADASIVVSSSEFDLLRGLLPSAPLHRIPILRETPRVSPEAKTPSVRPDFLFIGGFDHMPNGDGVKYFVKDVLPILRARGFTNRFVIAGSNVPDEIAALASENIEVRGYVKDLASLFANCRLSVAPLRIGAGVKGKIVTSLSYHVPVVATSIGAEGMNLRHDENILIADDPAAMAEQIMRLYADDDLWRKISVNGYRAFRDTFSHEAGAGSVLGVFDRLAASPRTRPNYNDWVTERDELVRARDDALAERDAMLTSKSWRVTAPLRSFRRVFRRG